MRQRPVTRDIVGAVSIRVLIIEDDEDFRDSVCSYLEDVGMRAEGIVSAEDLESRLARPGKADVLVCDANLPGESGFSVVARLRLRQPEVGLILLTGRRRQEDRMLGFSLGADHYMVKPVDLTELELVIRNLHRRVAGNGEAKPTVRGAEGEEVWQLDIRRWLLTAPNGRALRLSASEQQFLRRLIDGDGEVVSREDLLLAMNRPQYAAYFRNLDVTVSRLRRRVREACDENLPVVAARGQGYVFTGTARLIAP